MDRKVEIKHFHIFCGLGGGARGFNQADARVGNLRAHFRCIGGVDVDKAAIADFTRLAGVPGTVLDLFAREQYQAFHGKEPPKEWREATPEDLRAAAGHERPHIVFLSAPCKGFSGLLSEARARTDRYQALNALTLRGMWLMLEAWADDPPELIAFENVPRIAVRGRYLLDQIGAMLRQYGYAVAETTHDCGELGNLAQSRKRFLLVARHVEKIAPFVYEPIKRPLRAVGDVLEYFPLPGSQVAGAMHRLPALQWRTWTRLAFVTAGKDWRSLNRLAVEDGYLRDYLLVPEMHRSVLGVTHWEEPSFTIRSNSWPMTGKFSVADPRINGHQKSVQMGVRRWDQTAALVTSSMFVGGGPNAIADPRLNNIHHNNVYRVVRWDRHSLPVTAGAGPTAGGLPVADPRCGLQRGSGDHYETAGHYGIVPWTEHAYAVTGTGRHDNGPCNVADPRLPAPNDKLVALIRAEDNTWHRPFTTLELAALQGLVEPEEHLELSGLSDTAWRERIGNAVPPPAAKAIASVMGQTLLLALNGESFMLHSQPIWVRPIATALAVDCGQLEESGPR